MHFKKLHAALFVLLFGNLSAQNVNRDTAFHQGAVTSAVNSYQSFVAGQEMYYNGSAYSEPPQTSEEHPFYLTDDFIAGSLLFRGEHFENIPLLYDIMLDEVVIESVSSGLMLVTKKKLSAFTINGNTFRRFDSTFGNSLPRTGYYQVLYDGKSSVISLHQKTLQESIESRKLEIHFEEKSKYFILIEDHYYPIKGKSSILKLLADRKSDLRSHININKLNFRREKEAALKSVAAFYDTLTSQE